MELRDLLRPALARQTRRNFALSSDVQLLTALRFYATGIFIEVVGEGYGLSKTSGWRCRDSNSDEAYLPCTLALMATHLDSIQTLRPATVKLLSAVVVAVATLSFFKLVPAILRQRSVSGQRSSASSESREEPERDGSSADLSGV